MSIRSSLLFTLLTISLSCLAADQAELNRELRNAASVDDDEALVLLLDAGADVDAANQFGKTALMNAVENGNISQQRLDNFLHLADAMPKGLG
jgi:ankyrin repeat protein